MYNFESGCANSLRGRAITTAIIGTPPELSLTRGEAILASLDDGLRLRLERWWKWTSLCEAFLSSQHPPSGTDTRRAELHLRGVCLLPRTAF